jgi:HPt (histidine-containing phosphotransfer) domain-containing protein
MIELDGGNVEAERAGDEGVPRPRRGTSLDRAAIGRLVATCGHGGGAVVAALLETFCADAPRLAAALRRALAEGDAGEVRRAAHTLKSHGLTFGAPFLAQVARAVELAARDEDLVGAGAWAGELEIECGLAREALTALRLELLAGSPSSRAA